MIETKECSKCGKLKELKQFEKKRAVCKSCIAFQRSEAFRRKAEESLNEDSVEALPQIDEPEITFTKSIILEEFDIDSDTLKSRTGLESFVAKDLLIDIQSLQKLISQYEQLAEESTSKRERKEYLAKVETATDKKAKLKMLFVKQFDLFSDLAKPIEDDPLYTPINFYLNTEVPQSSIVEPVFKIDPEHIQNLDGETNG